MNTTYPPEVIYLGSTFYETTYFVPLTTTFTPPARCYTLANSTTGNTFQVFNEPTASNSLDATPCLPTEVTSTPLEYVTTEYNQWVVLGPFICPSGYKVVSRLTYTKSSILTVCCPSGYSTKTYASTDIGGWETCTSVLPAGVPFETPAYNSYQITSAPYPVTFAAKGFSGWNIAPATATSDSYGSSVSVSGTKIGLGVGVSLGVVFLAVLIAWLSLKSHRKQKPLIESNQQSHAPSYDPGPMHHEMANDGVIRPHEMSHAAYTSELPAYRPPAQLHSTSQSPAELHSAGQMYELASPTGR